jgi:uncharacterized protein
MHQVNQVKMTVDPFEVSVKELRGSRGTRHVVRSGVLAEPLVADADSRVPAGAEAVADLTLQAFDGGVAVSGMVSTHWEGECRRCLTNVDGEVSSEVRELFRRGGGEDEGTYQLDDDRLNLREMVLDSLFASLPIMPLCRPDCRGICPRCGTDRNAEECGCEEVEVDPRWSVLDVLRSGDELSGEGDGGGPAASV